MKEKATNKWYVKTETVQNSPCGDPEFRTFALHSFVFWNYSSVFFHRIIIIFLLRLCFFAISLLLQFLSLCKMVIGQTDWKSMQIQAGYLTLTILFKQIKKK